MGPPRIEVVAAVLADAAGRVLLDQRPAGRPHAGWWEFPGGKLDAGESPGAAVVRELREELGIEVLAAVPILTTVHRYPERDVVLHCWRVSAWRGAPAAHDGQRLAWHLPAELPALQVLPADKPLLDWLRAPDRIAIVATRAGTEAACAAGVHCVQLRAPTLDAAAYAALAADARRMTRAVGATLILNHDPELALALGCDGVHLNSTRLAAITARPVPAEHWLSASVHDATELAQAAALGVDLLLIGPVRATVSHPGAVPIGWEGFTRLTAAAGRPCFALGGMAIGDLARAQQHGGRGIAGISAFDQSGAALESSPPAS